MAAASTSMCSSVTSGYSAATSVTTRRQSREAASILALSTDVTFPRLCWARRKAVWAMRRTSSAV